MKLEDLEVGKAFTVVNNEDQGIFIKETDELSQGEIYIFLKNGRYYMMWRKIEITPVKGMNR